MIYRGHIVMNDVSRLYLCYKGNALFTEVIFGL